MKITIFFCGILAIGFNSFIYSNEIDKNNLGYLNILKKEEGCIKQKDDPKGDEVVEVSHQKRTLPILIYGNSILRDMSKNIYSLDELIELMFETMYNANGVGIAAPQIGLNLRLFVIDGSSALEKSKEKEVASDAYFLNSKKVFINPKIIRYFGEELILKEGCLSIPGIPIEVKRSDKIEIEYLDEKWKKHRGVFSGILARIIQHEYDHIEGKLIIDHLIPSQRKEIDSKLEEISNGNIGKIPSYKIKLK